MLQHLLVQESSIESLLCGDQFLLDGAILVLQLINYSVAERQTPNYYTADRSFIYRSLHYFSKKYIKKGYLSVCVNQVIHIQKFTYYLLGFSKKKY